MYRYLVIVPNMKVTKVKKSRKIISNVQKPIKFEIKILLIIPTESKKWFSNVNHGIRYAMT
jgi:hypothetical protein